jgi:hypothetical protein
VDDTSTYEEATNQLDKLGVIGSSPIAPIHKGKKGKNLQ